MTGWLAWMLVAAGAEAGGVVLDAQRLPVAGARVDVVCASGRSTTRTDGQGTFRLPPTSDECTLIVEKDGFRGVSRRVDELESPAVIVLDLAGLTDSVDVVARYREDTELIPNGTTFSAESLRPVGRSTDDWIRFALLAASAPTRSSQIYVDGLPGAPLPPVEMIASISIDADPFSAERSDGDVTGVRIVTRSPGRQFRFHPGVQLPPFGGRDLSDRALKSTSRTFSTSLSSGIWRLPVTAFTSISLGRFSVETPVNTDGVPPHGAAASVPGEAERRSVMNGTRTGSGGLHLYYSPSADLRVRSATVVSGARSTNVATGGLVAESAGHRSRSASTHSTLSLSAAHARFTYEGGVVVAHNGSELVANSVDQGVIIPGIIQAGGAPMAGSEAQRLSWLVRHVVRSASARPWSVGVILSRVTNTVTEQPNPLGFVQFSTEDDFTRAVAGEGAGTWFVTRGDGRVAYRQSIVSPFVQKTIVRTAYLEMGAGLRGDYASGFATLVSPRVTMAGRWRGYLLRGGAGLFVHGVSDRVLTRALQNDERHLQTHVATGVLLGDTSNAVLAALPTARTVLDPGLSRPREVMQRISLERRIGGSTPSVEFSWSRTSQMLGSDRVPAPLGWYDTLDSNRHSRRRSVHAQWRYERGGQQLSAHYEHVRAMDDTDGPFSFPAVRGDIAGEWARSAGIARHNVVLVGTFAMPFGVSLTVTDTWHGSVPYNITTGRDVRLDGIYTDRAGAPRNAGDAPAVNVLSLNGYRRVPLPARTGRRRAGRGIGIGVQAENLLNSRHFSSVGQVTGRPTLGRPLGSMPGRSVRVWLSVD